MKEKKRNIKSDLARLDQMKDEDIDYSDIPELDDAFFDQPLVDFPLPQPSDSITLRIKHDVLTWFQRGGKRGYQTRINAVLEAYVKAQQKREGKH